MIYLLDANIISELVKPQPDAQVLAWYNTAEFFIPTPVIAELYEGANATPSPAKRLDLLTKYDALVREHRDFIADWDAETARTWGQLRHSPEVKRQPQALWDSLIDAQAVQRGATVATRNTGDFRHAPTFNPFEPLPA